MSSERKYTMYREDARGTIEVDLDDPIYSLNQLIEKQELMVQRAEETLERHQDGVKVYTARLDTEAEVLRRLVVARNATQAALGENDE